MRLIDADALKQTIGSYNPIKYTYEYGFVITVADIDNAPTIEAEPVKRGKWVEDEDLTLPSHCSVCGEYALEWVETRYCPWCGARMDEVENGGNKKALREASQLPWFPIMMRELGYEPVKTGKWIKISDRNYKCSVCGDWWSGEEEEIKTFIYCPNCGAKMED